MRRLRGERPEVPLHVVVAQVVVRAALLRADEVLELQRVAQEEHRGVVPDHVVVALGRVELQREAARVTPGVGAAPLPGHGGEPDEGVRGGAGLEHRGLGVGADVLRHLEVAERAAALGVRLPLRDPLPVEVRHLLDAGNDPGAGWGRPGPRSASARRFPPGCRHRWSWVRTDSQSLPYLLVTLPCVSGAFSGRARVPAAGRPGPCPRPGGRGRGVPIAPSPSPVRPHRRHARWCWSPPARRLSQPGLPAGPAALHRPAPLSPCPRGCGPTCAPGPVCHPRKGGLR